MDDIELDNLDNKPEEEPEEQQPFQLFRADFQKGCVVKITKKLIN